MLTLPIDSKTWTANENRYFPIVCGKRKHVTFLGEMTTKLERDNYVRRT